MTLAVSANNTPFMYYTTGIINSTACNTAVDHAIGVIGYGTDTVTAQDYWVVRNSWATTWGELGYARIKIDYTGVGGVTNNLGFCNSHTEMYRAVVKQLTYK